MPISSSDLQLEYRKIYPISDNRELNESSHPSDLVSYAQLDTSKSFMLLDSQVRQNVARGD